LICGFSIEWTAAEASLILKPKSNTESAKQSRLGSGKKFSIRFAVDIVVELIFAPEVDWYVLEALS
jgi:hypothetical protein